ncbi:hypothetical protein N7D90_12180 [Pseudomonas fragi]|uniref:hypothetical protein n=1 Tax=Pseudomonas fragi TaxID=296 RepID=UPI0021BE1AFF|nr:hypothetical protein [Pseudomonas fragi]UXL36390.1 hypothetical protein N7D90_12180 [Pseudomonas fragi]
MDRVQELLFITNRITKEYETLLPLLRDPEVAKAVSFLSELDSLAENYEFMAVDIVRLIDPGRAEKMQSDCLAQAKSPKSTRVPTGKTTK